MPQSLVPKNEDLDEAAISTAEIERKPITSRRERRRQLSATSPLASEPYSKKSMEKSGREARAKGKHTKDFAPYMEKQAYEESLRAVQQLQPWKEVEEYTEFGAPIEAKSAYFEESLGLEAGEQLVEDARKMAAAGDDIMLKEFDIPEDRLKLWYKEYGLTPNSTVGEMNEAIAAQEEEALDLTAALVPKKPTDYASEIMKLDTQIGTADQAIEQLAPKEAKYQEELAEESHKATAAANQFKLDNLKTIEKAKKERVAADADLKKLLVDVNGKMDQYGEPYLEAMQNEFNKTMAGPPDSQFAKALGHEGPAGLGPWGFFDKNGFSWAGTAQTLLWGIGVLANTALSIGAAASGKGQVPNYLLDAMFKAFEHDFDSREEWWKERKKKTDAARGGMDAVVSWATQKVDKKTAWRDAVYNHAGSIIDQIEKDPKFGEISKNPNFIALKLDLQEKLFSASDQARLAHLRQKKVSLIETIKARKGLMTAASQAQSQEFSANWSRIQMIEAINKSKTEPITKLDIDDQRYWGAAFEQHQRILQAKSLINLIIEREGASGNMDISDIILANTQLGKVLGDDGAFLIQELHDLGEIIGRYQARKLDVGNLNKEEQQFGQEKSFLAQQKLEWILKTIEVYEHQNITGMLARRTRTSPEIRHHLDITLHSMGISNADEITKSMVTGDFTPDISSSLGHYSPQNFVKNWRTKYEKAFSEGK